MDKYGTNVPPFQDPEIPIDHISYNDQPTGVLNTAQVIIEAMTYKAGLALSIFVHFFDGPLSNKLGGN